jgi:hypothetical protein
LVCAVLRDDEEGQGGDGVGVGCGGGRVDDGSAWVFGELGGVGCDGGGGGGGAGLDVFAGEIANVGDGKFVLLGVDELDVADAAGRLADLLGDALGALAAEADGPGDGAAFADFGEPVGRDGGEVGGEGCGGAGAVSTMGYDDLDVGSCQVVILPRNMPAMASAESCNGCEMPGRL